MGVNYRNGGEIASREVLRCPQARADYYIAVLYVNASVLLTQDMATPKEMVDARLRELGWTKAEFSRKLGYSGYGGYYDLFSAQRTQLTDERLEQIADLLQKPRDWLKARGEQNARKREHYIREQFALYLESEVGKSADPETHKILGSMQWTGKWLPDVRLYQALTLVMEGRYTTEQVLDAIKLEEEDRKALVGSSRTARQITPAAKK